MRYLIYTDGGARGNPGPGAAAFIIQSSTGEVLEKAAVYLGVVTNNQAEYEAVKLALIKLRERFGGNHEVEIRSDSLLVVKQLSGHYKIKNSQLKETVEQIKQLSWQIGQIFYQHIRRSANYQADWLVNEVLDHEQDFKS